MSMNPSFSRRAFLASALGGATVLSTGLPLRVLAQTPAEATLAYGSTGYTWAVPFVAEALDTWKDQGVRIKAVDFPTGRESMQAVFGGSAQFSTSTDTPFILAALQGLKPVVLCNYSRYSRDMQIAVRTDGSVDPNTPASLKGKKIATRVGTSGQYLLAKYLELAGLDIKDVTVIDMSPSDMAVALTRGDVDAFSWTAQAASVASRQTGGKVTTMTQDGLEKYFQSHQLILTTQQVLDRQPELATAAVKALLAAEARIQSDPAWPALIAQRVHASPEEIDQATKGVFEFRVDFTPRFIDDLEAQAQWAISAGLAKPPKGDLRQTLRSLVHTDTLRAIAPERVAI